MSDTTERDKLAHVIRERWRTAYDEDFEDFELADAILADFLPEHDKQVKAEAWDEALGVSAVAFFDGDNAPIVNPYREAS